MSERQKDRRLRMSLSVASLFEKLSSYEAPTVEVPKRSYEQMSDLASSSEDIVTTLSDEINREFTKCHLQN